MNMFESAQFECTNMQKTVFIDTHIHPYTQSDNRTALAIRCIFNYINRAVRSCAFENKPCTILAPANAHAARRVARVRLGREFAFGLASRGVLLGEG